MKRIVPNTTSPAQSPPVPNQKPPGAVLPVVFLVLFIDLAGFSIIFPLFPSMLEYYHQAGSGDALFAWVYRGLVAFSAWSGAPEAKWGIIALFGGVLGSLYSLLQFVCAPVLGTLSDRYGRRPILLVSLAGLAVSYGMWFFAAQFWVLVLSRVIGGVMSANIATASAAVADVTPPEKRSRGMALIGVAFGLGFVAGPALGGITAEIDLTAYWPALARYGVNPFSGPAAVALILTTLNLAFAAAKLPETRVKGGGRDEPSRTLNPVRMFLGEKNRGVRRTVWVNFLFNLAFAGLEFSLTFLAVERLGFGPRQNTYLFLFIGAILIVVQGGYVRRASERVGPRRMARHGLLMALPGFLLIGGAASFQSVGLLYAGLFCIAVGTAQVSPCLAALSSLYAPPQGQGRALGMFRSAGALARVLGPLAVCFLYWRFDAAKAYYAAGAFVVVPLALALTLPPTPRDPAPNERD